MPNSYVCLHVHIVFSTKNRVRTINQDVQPKLWAYMAGILKNHGMHAVAIGGIEDHIHALFDLGPILGLAKAVQVLKSNSSRWMNERRRTRFEWQEGYFAGAVSRSQVRTVMRYIANQKEHHKKMDSATEPSRHFRTGLQVVASFGTGLWAMTSARKCSKSIQVLRETQATLRPIASAIGASAACFPQACTSSPEPTTIMR